MSSFRAWLSAARLRTLPLSVSGILVGTALANFHGYHNTTVLILALLTTIGFQITSNFANDYGDGVKGTDNEDRIGPARALQSGILDRRQLKKGIIYSIVINLVLVMALLYTAFGIENLNYIFVFMALGAASLWAAVRYTVGEGAYGYKGLGDVFVFIFFGLVAVLGTLFLFTSFLEYKAVFPAITIGLLSTAVLNLNNLRDLESDKRAKKNTLIVKLGLKNGKVYHYLLLIISFVSLFYFVFTEYNSWSNAICFLAYLPILLHFRTVYSIKDPVLFDPELKKLALSTFLLALLFYIGYNNFL
ncbi:1,4-dihydroxy-2-naphthoate octaprenyltransferase [Muriicola sp. Z0-33]|uniref:1,4-dihydroxy-2-naphthoate octaprenyltransferase n=1 Tax=Muriicola sp. Z0-33 TaxID=2816957 RepID=UPI0022388154|nr:1,4-dihydroxy-2-naphthoate octaprenyltransferase [Muriicola sp. Z0-33]MCW5516603.1 1,4-dihydroxy-2-naphthoate octaprenyltransferase [Muriicola sp. Z0-33]